MEFKVEDILLFPFFFSVTLSVASCGFSHYVSAHIQIHFQNND